MSDDKPLRVYAVLPGYRNQGIGRQLLTHLLATAKAAYPLVSLSIKSSNLALRLYKQLGCKIVDGSETINRVGGISFKMKLDFD
jgi:ribosomal protein S18 acetylase RimI-like enzyme